MKTVLRHSVLGLTLIAGASPTASEELELEVIARETAAMVSRAGYNCPIGKAYEFIRTTPRGNIVKVWCGEDDGTRSRFPFAYQFLHVIVGDKAKGTIITPWEE